MSEICYLCGEPIEKQDGDKDHVIAKQFYLKRLRRKFNLNKILTLPTHKKCNEEYQQDEDYFFLTLGGVADDNPITKEVWHELRKRVRRPESKKINQKILSQIELRPKTQGGIDVPYAAMHFDRKRVDHVLWKITRGLYWVEFKQILRKDKPFTIDPIHPEHTGLNPAPVSQLWVFVRNQEEHGEYGKIFAYKYLTLSLRQKIPSRKIKIIYSRCFQTLRR
jgi:hypothetical protein